MKLTNLEIVNRSFTQQASMFESSLYNFSKRDYLEHTVKEINFKKSDTVLEIAA